MFITNSRYTLVGYFITSYPTRAHGIIVIYSTMCGPVAQWIRHLTTNQGIPGSNPSGDDYLSYVKTKKYFFIIIKSTDLNLTNWCDDVIVNQHVKEYVFFLVFKNLP